MSTPLLEFTKNLPPLFDGYEGFNINKTSVSSEFTKEVAAKLGQLSQIDWLDTNLSKKTLATLKRFGEESSISSTLEEAKQAYNQNGVCVISFGKTLEDGACTKLKLVTALTAFGVPFGAFKERGFWQILGVNKSASPMRAESDGYIPLHIDFDQASLPPDGVALFCLRPDPFGGGESLIFNYSKFLSSLSEKQIETLEKVSYSYSTLFNQNGIGDIYNPHPLIEIENNKPVFLRYNGKALPDLDNDQSCLFSVLEENFKAYSTNVSLCSGDLIIVDQNKTLHGRLALNHRNSNEQVLPENDRFLLQTYIRHDCHTQKLRCFYP